MFSKNQQQSLNELGIQVLALQTNDTDEQASASPATRTMATDAELTNNHTKPEQRTTRPPLSSLLKPSQTGNPAEAAATASVPVKLLSWHKVAENFIGDLKVLFPQIVLNEDKLHLTDQKVWVLKSDLVAPMVDGKSLNTGLPTNLSVDERKLVWQWLVQA